jgi:TatD DNase family protein
MFLVDSHCHLHLLDLTPYSGELSTVLSYAETQGVGHFLCVSVRLDELPAVLSIAHCYPYVSASVGVHPNEVIAHEPSVEELFALSLDEKIVAIGETGLDYFRSEGNLEWQQTRFRHHIRAAIQCKKPLIIHTRQAALDTLAIMREEGASSVGGVMHCFTEEWDIAKAAMDLNFFISLSGIVTFPNAAIVQETAKKIPLDRLLIETDAPYLAPVPHRGKPNEPAYVKYVAERIAALRGIDVLEVAEVTTKNFFRLFRNAKG